MAKGQFVEAGSDLGHRNWPLGPYRADSMFGRRRGKEVGTSVEFCYPKEQYDAFNQQRDEAQTRMMMLAPRMAEVILALDEQDVQIGESEELANELRAIDSGKMFWVCLDNKGNIVYRSESRNDAVDYSNRDDNGFQIGNMFLPTLEIK